MRKTFTFDNILSSDLGIYINGAGAYNSPEPDLEYIKVPGRSGDLIYDNNRLKNFDLVYPASFMLENFETNFQLLKQFLLTHKGYYRLEDDYHPGYFRMASIDQGIDASKIDWVNGAGSFDLRFNCKPQLYDADSFTYVKKVTVTSGNSAIIYNRYLIPYHGGYTYLTGFPAKPRILAYGSGSFTVNDVTVTIAAHNYNHIEIDCELMDCFYQGNNCNSLVSFSKPKYPILDKSSNSVSVSGLTKIEIFPRFWTV